VKQGRGAGKALRKQHADQDPGSQAAIEWVVRHERRQKGGSESCWILCPSRNPFLEAS